MNEWTISPPVRQGDWLLDTCWRLCCRIKTVQFDWFWFVSNVMLWFFITYDIILKVWKSLNLKMFRVCLEMFRELIELLSVLYTKGCKVIKEAVNVPVACHTYTFLIKIVHCVKELNGTCFVHSVALCSCKFCVNWIMFITQYLLPVASRWHTTWLGE